MKLFVIISISSLFAVGLFASEEKILKNTDVYTLGKPANYESYIPSTGQFTYSKYAYDHR